MIRILVSNVLLPFTRELKQSKTFSTALWNSYPGNLLIGISILALAIIIDLCNTLFLHYTISLTRYGMISFVLLMAVMLARLYSKARGELAKKISQLANPPEAALRERSFIEHALSQRETEVARLIIPVLITAKSRKNCLSPKKR